MNTYNYLPTRKDMETSLASRLEWDVHPQLLASLTGLVAIKDCYGTDSTALKE